MRDTRKYYISLESKLNVESRNHSFKRIHKEWMPQNFEVRWKNAHFLQKQYAKFKHIPQRYVKKVMLTLKLPTKNDIVKAGYIETKKNHTQHVFRSFNPVFFWISAKDHVFEILTKKANFRLSKYVLLKKDPKRPAKLLQLFFLVRALTDQFKFTKWQDLGKEQTPKLAFFRKWCFTR